MKDLRFKIIVPDKTGHSTTVLESVDLLAEWVDGIDFTVLDSGPNKGGGNIWAVEDVIVTSKPQFMQEVDKIVALHEAGDFPRDEVEVRQVRRMVGGAKKNR